MTTQPSMGPVRQIVFLFDSTRFAIDVERFGASTLEANGFHLEFWDLSPFLYPHLYERERQAHQTFPDVYRLFKTIEEMRRALAALEPSCLIYNAVSRTPHTYPFLLRPSQTSLRYCVSTVNAIPMPTHLGLAQRLRTLTPSQFAKSLKHRLQPLQHPGFHRNAGIRPPSLVLLGGERSLQMNPHPVDPTTQFLWIHATDYDVYLVERQRSLSAEGQIAVFLDEYTPFHSDSAMLGLKVPVTPDRYYGALSRFFAQIEQKLGVPVVIAAHPQSRYEEMPDYFQGRRVLRGQTARLVHESRLVLGHASTSLKYAVLFHKPVIFITTNEGHSNWWGHCINSAAAEFKKQPINIDLPQAIDWAYAMEMDDQAYKAHMQAWIKKAGSPDLPFWQVFADYVRKEM